MESLAKVKNKYFKLTKNKYFKLFFESEQDRLPMQGSCLAGNLS